MVGDAAIVDEIAHVPAGYSYVTKADYRLNPEHPPLLKDLAGIGLLPLNPEFPDEHISWTKDVNGQWESGWNFLYHYGNDADLMLFFSRLPLLLLAIGFGWLLYIATRRHFGTMPALLVLFLYSLSPNFLAHSHFITTDMGIAAFMFLALLTFGEFTKTPNKKTLVIATIGLALAHLTKFSSVLLVPFFGLILLIVAIAGNKKILLFSGLPKFKKIKSIRWQRIYQYAVGYLFMMVGSLLVVWFVYIFHTFNFPADKQIELITTSLPAPILEIPKNILIALSGNPITQPLAQYLLGVAMVFTRVAGGNTTFFLGEVTNQSFKWYFPISYLLKTPLPTIFLVILSLVIWFKDQIRLRFKNIWERFLNYSYKHPLKLTFLLFIFYYGGISISGNLNLGIRHLFPILPLIYILAASKSIEFFASFKNNAGKKLAAVLVTVLLAWYGFGTVNAYPNYVSYHNEIIGGGENAYLYFTDSNVDWGQDLKRLVKWLDTQPQIDKLKLDYFGGGEPRYYLCSRKVTNDGFIEKSSTGYNCDESRYQEFHVQDGPAVGWIAVSVTFLQNAEWYARLHGQQDYDWLRYRTPYAKIGNSIFVYWVR